MLRRRKSTPQQDRKNTLSYKMHSAHAIARHFKKFDKKSHYQALLAGAMRMIAASKKGIFEVKRVIDAALAFTPAVEVAAVEVVELVAKPAACVDFEYGNKKIKLTVSGSEIWEKGEIKREYIKFNDNKAISSIYRVISGGVGRFDLSVDVGGVVYGVSAFGATSHSKKRCGKKSSKRIGFKILVKRLIKMKLYIIYNNCDFHVSETKPVKMFETKIDALFCMLVESIDCDYFYSKIDFDESKNFAFEFNDSDRGWMIARFGLAQITMSEYAISDLINDFLVRYDK